jgi:hypothetical protein
LEFLNAHRREGFQTWLATGEACHEFEGGGLRCAAKAGSTTTISYRHCHFPREIVQRAVWLYAQVSPSFRDDEALPDGRGIEVSYGA